MRFVSALAGLWFCASGAMANPDIDRLVDAMGMPALVRAFAAEGEMSAARLDSEFLNGTGGAVWAETVRKLYDPVRLEEELRSGLVQELDPEVARTALLFLESDLGQRIVALELQGREAMLDSDVKEMAEAAGALAGPQVTDFIALRNLTERNTDAAIAAQTAFFEGMAATITSAFAPPDIEEQRPNIMQDTRIWLTGYYALVQSALSDSDIETYTDFWRTEVGATLDDTLFEVFGQSYIALSYGLGQAVGRLIPPSEL
jgi:hypothetical protein